MKPLGPKSAKAMAGICGLTLAAITVFQYGRVSGIEPLAWLHISPGPLATSTRAVVVAALLLVTFVSFERACHVIGALATGAWSGAGSGLFLLLAWIGTLESARPAYIDTREALQLLTAPIGIICLLALFAVQVLTLLRYAPLRSMQTSGRPLIVVAAVLALFSMLIGLGPFRLQLGEWHYVLALWAGDAACVGFLAGSRMESVMTPERRSVLIRGATGSIGIVMLLLAVLI